MINKKDKFIIIIILVFSLSGCATLDENRPKGKGWWNTIIFGGLIAVGVAAGNQNLGG